jgi:hypothetical protein
VCSATTKADGEPVEEGHAPHPGLNPMLSTMIEPANLFRLVHFFDVLAAVVFAVSGALVASRKGLDVRAFM